MSIKKEKINLALNPKQVRDYSYTVAFFLILSFFIFFVIRPNIKTIYEANLTLEKLRKDDAIYEYEIENILLVQDKLMEVRDDLSLIDKAVPQKPEINQLINQINKLIEKNNLLVENFTLSDFNLKDISRQSDLKPLVFLIQLRGNFKDFLNFSTNLFNQRRLKWLKKIEISKSSKDLEEFFSATESAQITTGSANLLINLNLEGYYL